jgi:hypothetical protein
MPLLSEEDIRQFQQGLRLAGMAANLFGSATGCDTKVLQNRHFQCSKKTAKPLWDGLFRFCAPNPVGSAKVAPGQT